MEHKTWLDEMKSPENIEDAVDLIYKLTWYHGKGFCVSRKTLLEKFPFLNKDNINDNINELGRKLHEEGIVIFRTKLMNTMNKLGDDEVLYYIFNSNVVSDIIQMLGELKKKSVIKNKK